MTAAEIVDTAESFVREFGFHRLTVRSLAEAANDSKSHVEQAIGSMPALVDALEERAAAALFGVQGKFFVDRVLHQPVWSRMAFAERSEVPKLSTYAGLMYKEWSDAADLGPGDRARFEEFVRVSTGALVELILSLSPESLSPESLSPESLSPESLSPESVDSVEVPAGLPEAAAGTIRESLVSICDQTFRLHLSAETLLRDEIPMPTAEPGPGVATLPAPVDGTTRDHVVHAATVLVKRHGIDEVSVRRIAEEANCGKSTVQAIVGDRASLVDLLRASARVDFLAVLNELGPSESPEYWATYLAAVADYQQSNHYWALLAADRGSSWEVDVSLVRPGFAGTVAWTSPMELVGVADFVARSMVNALELAAHVHKTLAVQLLDVSLAALVEAVSTLDQCESPR